MLPIYNAAKIKEWDKYTIESQSLSSWELMERAATKFARWYVSNFKNDLELVIFCGNGNNGGDGLAIARLLSLKNYKVQIALVDLGNKSTEDNRINLEKIASFNIPLFNTIDDLKKGLSELDKFIIIDAILGCGINRPASEIRPWISYINSLNQFKIAIDIPTGLYVDDLSEDYFLTVDVTYTFQSPKLSQLLDDSGRHCGQLIIADIGLSENFTKSNLSKLQYLEKKDIQHIYKPRNAYDWKNKFGHVLIIGGALGMAGAALFAAKSALRSGCGLCSISSDIENTSVFQSNLPEAIWTNINNISYEKYAAYVIGPGLGKDFNSDTLLYILKQIQRNVVLDADALNVIAANNLLNFIPANSVLTPHVGEFDRLFGKCENTFKRLERAILVCAKHSLYIVLKAHHTAVICPDGMVYFNSTGNPALAKGGSGDVLSGMIASYLAQSYTITDACLMAVYIHGLAADLAIKHVAAESLLTSELIQYISNAIMELK